MYHGFVDESNQEYGCFRRKRYTSTTKSTFAEMLPVPGDERIGSCVQIDKKEGTTHRIDVNTKRIICEIQSTERVSYFGAIQSSDQTSSDLGVSAKGVGSDLLTALSLLADALLAIAYIGTPKRLSCRKISILYQDVHAVEMLTKYKYSDSTRVCRISFLVHVLSFFFIVIGFATYTPPPTSDPNDSSTTAVNNGPPFPMLIGAFFLLVFGVSVSASVFYYSKFWNAEEGEDTWVPALGAFILDITGILLVLVGNNVNGSFACFILGLIFTFIETRLSLYYFDVQYVLKIHADQEMVEFPLQNHDDGEKTIQAIVQNALQYHHHIPVVDSVGDP